MGGCLNPGHFHRLVWLWGRGVCKVLLNRMTILIHGRVVVMAVVAVVVAMKMVMMSKVGCRGQVTKRYRNRYKVF